ncbi:MAG: MlaA family lipoprotein [Gammaproteobacteria bacterium]
MKGAACLLVILLLAFAVPSATAADEAPLLVAQQNAALVDPFTDDEAGDDPFENDPFEDDPLEGDPFEDDPFGDGSDDSGQIASDPLEAFNRGMFWFNDKLYSYALKPVAKVYRVVPEPARVSVSNFFSNLTSPISIVNATLQLKFKDAGVQLGRLVINSTLGIGGLFDPARSEFNLREKDEDFGQTMGRYGVGSGFYLVLPFVGPTSARDAVGSVADGFANPIVYLAEGDAAVIVGARTFRSINSLSLDKDTYESIKAEQLDPYLFVRDAYLQNRAANVSK